MAGILSEIFHLFCCPPKPSHIIAKLAFVPPRPTYTITLCPENSKCLIQFKPESGWQISEELASKFTVFYTITKRQSRIVCLYIPAYTSSYTPSPVIPSTINTGASRTVSPVAQIGRVTLTNPGPNSPVNTLSISCPTLIDDESGTKCFAYRLGAANPIDRKAVQIAAFIGDAPAKSLFTVLFSHGNAVDIGQMAGFLQSLAYRFGVNIMCYDYSGYGASSGQRSEDNLYADAEAVLTELRQRYNLSLDQIVLYGQSIGTAPTVELAIKYKVAGVVLHSPLMSGLRVVCPGTTRHFCFDPFTNINKVSRILSPTLIIHGTDDEIVGINHGRELFTRLAHPLEPAWIDGAGHNDIELFSEYATRLDRFFNEDLFVPTTSSTGTSVVTTEPSLYVHPGQLKTGNTSVSAKSVNLTPKPAVKDDNRMHTASSFTSPSTSPSDSTISFNSRFSEPVQKSMDVGVVRTVDVADSSGASTFVAIATVNSYCGGGGGTSSGGTSESGFLLHPGSDEHQAPVTSRELGSGTAVAVSHQLSSPGDGTMMASTEAAATAAASSSTVKAFDNADC